MNMRRWEWRLVDLAILSALFLVINPELRALLIVVDALSLELILFLLLIQLRGVLPIIAVALLSASRWCCVSSFCTLRGILRVFGAILPGRALCALSTLLFVLSQNLWCPLSRQSRAACLQT
jgi:hypothetical protein